MATGQLTSGIRRRFLLSLVIACLSFGGVLNGWADLAQTQTKEGRSQTANQLFERGLQQIQGKQFPGAIATWQTGLMRYRQAGDRLSEMKLLAYLGNAYYSIGDDEAAIAHYQQSLAIAQMLKDQSHQGIALAGLGKAAASLGDYRQAIAYQQQTLAIAQAQKNHPAAIQALSDLGIAYESLGHSVQAIDFHQQSLKVARQIGDRASESVALRNLGTIYYLQAQYSQAIAAFQQDLAIQRRDQLIHKASNQRTGEGWLLGNLAKAHYALGEYGKAIEFYQQQRAIARQVKDLQSESTALTGLGVAYYYQGDYATAIAYQQQSLALVRQLQDPQTEAAVLANLGSAYVSLGEYQTAFEFYQQSLAIARTSQHPQSISAILDNLGRTYLLAGNYANAIAAHEQGLAIAQQVGDRHNQGIAIGNLGTAYQALGETTKAINYTQQWLTIAQEIGDRSGESAALDDLGWVYASLGKHSAAIEYYQQSLAIARQIGNRRREGLVLDHIGKAQFKAGNLAAAEKNLRASIQVWESLREKLGDTNSHKSNTITQVDANKVSLFETQASTYRSLQQVLVAQQKTDAALEIAERSRTRAFVELLATKLDPPSDQYQKAIAQSSPLSISHIQQIAKTQNATLVEYSILYDDVNVDGQIASQESALYIWVIQPTGTITFRQVDLKTFSSHAAQANLSRKSLLTFEASPSEIQSHLKELHEVLIRPIADLLPSNPNQRLIFVPQGSLFFVPFAALRDRSGAYLIEQHTLLTTPSIQVLDLTRKQRDRQNWRNQSRKTMTANALVVGNPSPMPPPLPPLPDAALEATAIANLLNVSALTGNQATRATVLQQMPTARWIHFATHGILNNQQGLKSAIALATTATDDGFLTAEQLLDLPLQAELVVLSACNTGRGRITGDGVIGLSRSLITAGVPSVIVSLWTVPDAPTASLMTTFYQHLKRTPDKAQALRQAMLTALQRHPNPFNWASFTLIGEAD
jgi:CHAT domain-containing protein